MQEKQEGAPRPAPAGLEKSAKMVWEKVEAHGWAVVYVNAGANTPGYAYTVGLFENYSHPDLMISGLPQTTSAVILNNLGKRVKQGENFEVCEPVDGVMQGYKARFAPMHPGWTIKMMALNEVYVRLSDLPSIQVLWPDVSGSYPDEEACDRDTKLVQPFCARPPQRKRLGPG